MVDHNIVIVQFSVGVRFCEALGKNNKWAKTDVINIQISQKWSPKFWIIKIIYFARHYKGWNPGPLPKAYTGWVYENCKSPKFTKYISYIRYIEIFQ